MKTATSHTKTKRTGLFTVGLMVAGLSLAAVPASAFQARPASLVPSGPLSPSFVVVVESSAPAKDSQKMGQGAQDFVDNMAQKALDFLSDDDLDHDAKKKQFRRLLQTSFDMDTIGRFSLGRYWRTATKEQRTEYLSLFKNLIVEIYAARFSDYKGERFETRSFRTDGEKDTIVTSFIVPNDGTPDVQVDWRVRYKNGSYKIIDVLVEGVSMSVTQRSDFAAVIQRGGGEVQVLLDHLKSQKQAAL